jgi:hypothetical protein
MGRDADQGHGRGVVVRYERGRRIEPGLIDGGILGRDSLPAEQPLVRAPDAITHAKAGASLPDALDGARQVARQDIRKLERHRDRAGADIKVDRVERRRFHPYEYLPGPRLGRWQLADLDHFGRARLFDIGGTHGGAFSVVRAPTVCGSDWFRRRPIIITARAGPVIRSLTQRRTAGT